MAHDAGKGSRPRPYSIPQEEYVNRLDAIFKRQRKERTPEPTCPVCSGVVHTQENWKFYYCNNADCNGTIHKG